MPNWDNYIMRKYGQSIREEIAESFAVFAKAKVIVRKERLLEGMLRRVPEKKSWN